MTRIFLVLSLTLLTGIIQGQITITYNDLPSSNKAYLLTVRSPIGTFNPKLTGANYTWDFSLLIGYIQKKDTFIAPSGAPIAYQAYFNSYIEPKPDMAINSDHLTMFDSLNAYESYSLNDIYEYYKKDSNTFSQVGFAMNIKGLPVSVVYQFPDIIYSLPLVYGEKDSYLSFYETPPVMSSIFYYASSQTRNNHVDGWGTLKTPYGSFQVLRIRSEITSNDTFHIDSISKRFAKPKTYEYKWLGKNTGIPLLEIITQLKDTIENVISITYQDSVRKFSTSIEETNNFEHPIIYPNPFNNIINIDYQLNNNSFVKIELFNIYGQKVTELYQGNLPAGTYHNSYNINFIHQGPYCYFIKITTDTGSVVKKIMQITE